MSLETQLRIPPRDRARHAKLAQRLQQAAWHQYLSPLPDKFVLVANLDQRQLALQVTVAVTEAMPSHSTRMRSFSATA